jgi:long-chain fatty acid transport protein
MTIKFSHHEGGFMKKVFVLVLAVFVSGSMAFSAIITNSNQSIQYFRMLARNASTDIDAVFYNPAGLVKMQDGFHLAVHNQSIWQDKTITNSFPLLNNSSYLGTVRVPVYPDVYAVYKKGPLALSFGFGPNAGGGTAKFNTGLPTFEIPFAMNTFFIPALMGLPLNQYAMDMNFQGGSVYLGFQLNASYAITDWLAGAVGFRYISAKNTYTGAITNVSYNFFYGAMAPASTVFTSLGLPSIAALFANRAVDVEQTGSGFTPIIGFHLTPIEGLNIGIHYEFKTAIELTNKTTKDDTAGLDAAHPTGLFPDGAKTNADIPAIFAIGASYAIMPELRAHLSYTLYFDKDANWDGRETLVNANTYDLAIGLEYDVAKFLTLSAGYMSSPYDLKPNFQSALNFSLGADTVGFGAQLRVVPNLTIDLGVLIAKYKDVTQSIPYYYSGVLYVGTYAEKYHQTTLGIGFGLGYHFD